MEDTKTLVAGAASNQEQLAGAAQSAVMTITRLADCVKHGAASLGSEQPEAQVSGWNTRAARSVAVSIGWDPGAPEPLDSDCRKNCFNSLKYTVLYPSCYKFCMEGAVFTAAILACY